MNDASFITIMQAPFSFDVIVLMDTDEEEILGENKTKHLHLQVARNMSKYNKAIGWNHIISPLSQLKAQAKPLFCAAQPALLYRESSDKRR